MVNTKSETVDFENSFLRTPVFTSGSD